MTARRPRADAVANRAKIIATAQSMYRGGDQPVSLEAVARQAGVGIGTLYRHFSSREALAAAVYHREVDDLVALAGTLAEAFEPRSALCEWLRATVEFVATKKGMAAALARSARMPPDLTAYSSDHLTGAVERLLGRVAGHDPRDALLPGQDVLLMLVALAYEFDGPGWQDRVVRLLEVFVAGLGRSESSSPD